MKKLLKTAFMSTLVFSAFGVHALPIGNPAEPGLLIDGTMWEGISSMDPCDPCATWFDAISLRAGFYGDYVFDRILKTDTSKDFKMGMFPKAEDITLTNNAATAFNWSQAQDTRTITNRNNAAYGKHMQDAEWCTNAAILALNIWDRFDIFCTLGASSGYIKGNSAAFNLVGLIGAESTDVTITGTGTANAAPTAATLNPLKPFSDTTAVPNVTLGQGIVELYTDTSFAWSIGARASLWECGCATLGAEFQYAQSKPKVENLNVICNAAQFSILQPKGYTASSVKGNTSLSYEFPLPMAAGTVDAQGAAPKGVTAATIKYNEWQAGLALSYRLNMLVPYVGFKWSRASFDADNIRIAQPKVGTLVLGRQTWNPSVLGEVPNIFSQMTFSLPTTNLPAGATSAEFPITLQAASFTPKQHYGQTLQIVSMQINKLKSRKSCGFVVGATLIDADKWSITGEARLIDERAAHVSAQVRF